MGLATSCDEDITDNIKLDDKESSSAIPTGSNGNEGGSGGNTPPPGAN